MVRPSSGFIPRLAVLAAVGVLAGSLLRAAPPTEEGIHYFENHVRPILATHCYECHSSKASKLKGSLYLDSKAGILSLSLIHI